LHQINATTPKATAHHKVEPSKHPHAYRSITIEE